MHPDRMLANIEARDGYVLSEPVLLLLTDRIGKHAAHQAVYAATMAGIEGGLTFAEALRADPAVAALLVDRAAAPGEDLDRTLDRLLDPRSGLGATGELVDRVLAAAAARNGPS